MCVCVCVYIFKCYGFYSKIKILKITLTNIAEGFLRSCLWRS